MAKQKRFHTAKAALVRALELTEKPLDGFPIPGAKGTIGAVLEIIKEAEICATIHNPAFYHLYCQCREWSPTLNSVKT